MDWKWAKKWINSGLVAIAQISHQKYFYNLDDSDRHPSAAGSRLMWESSSARPYPRPNENESSARIVEQNIDQPVEGMKRCKVCDRLTIGTHYGAVVCGGCACMGLRRYAALRTSRLAFFRRTIGSGKSYQCTCRLPFRNKKKGIRAISCPRT